jgi:hypothetical protein
MGLRSFFGSRWIKIPLLLLLLLVLAAAGYLAYRLGTTTPGMYSTLGVAQPAFTSTPDDHSEKLVYTSLRPSNWDIYLFDSLDRHHAGLPTTRIWITTPCSRAMDGGWCSCRSATATRTSMRST